MTYKINLCYICDIYDSDDCSSHFNTKEVFEYQILVKFCKIVLFSLNQYVLDLKRRHYTLLIFNFSKVIMQCKFSSHVPGAYKFSVIYKAECVLKFTVLPQALMLKHRTSRLQQKVKVTGQFASGRVA